MVSFQAGIRPIIWKLKRDFEKRQAQQSEAKAKKERVIYQIQKLANTSDYRSASSEIKRLSDEFYNAGSAGKDNQELKERFNAARDRFYDAKKRASEQKHHEYIRSLQERIERKKEALSRLDNAIYNKQDQLDNLLSRPAPSYNNPRRWEIAANRNAKESSLNSAICDMKMKRSTIINEIAQLQSKLNSSCWIATIWMSYYGWHKDHHPRWRCRNARFLSSLWYYKYYISTDFHVGFTRQ